MLLWSSQHVYYDRTVGAACLRGVNKRRLPNIFTKKIISRGGGIGFKTVAASWAGQLPVGYMHFEGDAQTDHCIFWFADCSLKHTLLDSVGLEIAET